MGFTINTKSRSKFLNLIHSKWMHVPEPNGDQNADIFVVNIRRNKKFWTTTRDGDEENTHLWIK